MTASSENDRNSPTHSYPRIKTALRLLADYAARRDELLASPLLFMTVGDKLGLAPFVQTIGTQVYTLRNALGIDPTWMPGQGRPTVSARGDRVIAYAAVEEGVVGYDVLTECLPIITRGHQVMDWFENNTLFDAADMSWTFDHVNAQGQVVFLFTSHVPEWTGPALTPVTTLLAEIEGLIATGGA